MHTPLITAHSGCENTPENSLLSIQTGISLGADCVEVDVRLRSDGTLWLSHDVPEESAQPLTLAAAFEAVLPAGMAINCDLKDADALYPVLALAERLALPRAQLIFSGAVSIPALLKDENVARRSRIFLNSEEIVSHLTAAPAPSRQQQAQYLLENRAAVAQLLRTVQAEALNAPYKYFSLSDIALLQAEGIALSLWTVNEEDALQRLLPVNALNLTTRQPRAALTLRGEGAPARSAACRN